MVAADWNLWKKFSGLPEGRWLVFTSCSCYSLPQVWDMNFRVATSFQYPLRPEFIESTWYLYRVRSSTAIILVLALIGQLDRLRATHFISTWEVREYRYGLHTNLIGIYGRARSVRSHNTSEGRVRADRYSRFAQQRPR